FLDTLNTGSINSQQLIFPENLELSASQAVILDSIVENLKMIGFELEQNGEQWSITGVPSSLGNVNPVEGLIKILEQVAEGGDISEEDLLKTLALSLANVSAIPSGKQLTQQEMEHLINELFRLTTPSYTPSGNTVVSIIPLSDISKLFD
ncbi:MAG: DNA mismatch repair protein MutL, partial [Muribaculaceae bacterium]|nr:DNA mismatch repair protein MutL [Muribaculaceae bacterium]